VRELELELDELPPPPLLLSLLDELELDAADDDEEAADDELVDDATTRSTRWPSWTKTSATSDCRRWCSPPGPNRRPGPSRPIRLSENHGARRADAGFGVVVRALIGIVHGTPPSSPDLNNTRGQPKER
jgi:hypothetical protein